MKKILSIVIAIIFSIPVIAHGAFTVGRSATSTNTACISPNLVNGVSQVIRGTYFIATSTINSILPNFLSTNSTSTNATSTTLYSPTFNGTKITLSGAGTAKLSMLNTNGNEGYIEMKSATLDISTNGPKVQFLGTADPSFIPMTFNPSLGVGATVFTVANYVDKISLVLKQALNSAQTLNMFEIQDNTGAPLTVFGPNGELGIGTSSPYAKLSVVGQTVSAYFTATTSTASTFPYASTTMISATTASSTTFIAGIGTGSAPGITFTGDTDTGLYEPLANSI